MKTHDNQTNPGVDHGLRLGGYALCRGLYPAPIFHMDSIWIPCGFHVIPGVFHPFHMEYVLAGIPLIFLIPFHFDSMWIPYGFHIEWSYSITIPWNDHGFHME